MKLVILAGGSGSRLWPLSKKNSPKQLQSIIGDSTLLQKTYNRLRLGFDSADIYIATGADQIAAIKEQLPELTEDHFIAEPCRRDTAAAIGLAAFTLASKFPDEIMINVNSDHFVKDEQKYIEALKFVEKVILANNDAGVLIGVNSTYPETGYGYIKMGDEVNDNGAFKLYTIDSFKEKPDLDTAKAYFTQWEYLWNIGCFAWKLTHLKSLYQELLPQMSAHLENITTKLDQADYQQVLLSEFSKITPISMDYGIVEKANNLFVIPADFGWADIGHWRTVKDVLSLNQKDNVFKGNIIEVNSTDNLAYSYSNKLIALVGVENLVVVESEDTILVCHKDQAQDVKKIVDKLSEQGLTQYL